MIPRREIRDGRFGSRTVLLLAGMLFVSLGVLMGGRRFRLKHTVLTCGTSLSPKIDRHELFGRFHRSKIPPSTGAADESSDRTTKKDNSPIETRQKLEHLRRKRINKKYHSQKESLHVLVLTVLGATLMVIYAISWFVVQPIVGAIGKVCESATDITSEFCRTHQRHIRSNSNDSIDIIDAVAVPIVPATIIPSQEGHAYPVEDQQ